MTDTTLLRSLYLIPLPEIGQVRVIGIDDWAWRKGQSYGSILAEIIGRQGREKKRRHDQSASHSS